MHYYKRYINIDPEIRSGKPCVKGTHITVYDVLSYLAAGTGIEQLILDFPQLSLEAILACLSYSADAGNRYQAVFIS